MPKPRILVADDEKNVRRSLELALTDADYDVTLAENAFQVIEHSRAAEFDLLILDIRLGELTGIQALEKLRQEGVSTPALFISGNASLSEAVQTVRSGAADFLEKPFSTERLIVAVARAIRIGELERKLRQASQTHGDPNWHQTLGLLGDSPAIRGVRETIRKIAPTRSKVLIQGESGTGKELIAKAIHQLSPVAKGPFVKVNCAAIPSELIESELFGHERGAFTGATQMKRGLFELAHGGTIFLDEIAEMSPSAQAKVLRVLQSQEFTRVGGSAVLRSDARVLAATHKDLAVESRAGRFREDLFFRINVVPIRSVPLRERVPDIPILLDSFVRECCAENGFREKEIAPEVVDALSSYPWPGNVRELRNLAERLVILSGERIESRNLPEEYQPGSPPTHSSPGAPGGVLTLREFRTTSERQFLLEALRKAQGNITLAARWLDIERTHLHKKIQDLCIEKREYF